MSMAFMRALVARDLPAAEAEIGATVPADFPDQLDNFLQFRIADLSVDPAAQPWLGRAIVLTEPDGTRRIDRLGRVPRAAGPRRPGRDRLSRRARATAARASRPRSSGRCSTGPARAGRRPVPGVGRARTTSRRWRSSASSASARSASRSTTSTARSSSSSSMAGRPRADRPDAMMPGDARRRPTTRDARSPSSPSTRWPSTPAPSRTS